MAIRDLLAAFEGAMSLPVDLRNVSAWAREKGLQDEIEFIGVDLDVEIIRGFLFRFRYNKAVYGEHVNCAHVYYGKNQEEEWINIVCAKELCHLADGSAPVKRKEELENLLSRLSLPNAIKILLEDPEYAAFDKFGDAFAAALLLPMASRQLLRPHFQAGTITSADIARLAVMPERYVRLVMSDRWEPLYERMKQI